MRIAYGLAPIMLAALVTAKTLTEPLAVQSIVARSAQANRRDWAAAPEYSYFEEDRSGSGTKTYEVTMILGSPYRRLTAIDGEPLSSANQKLQEQRLNAVIARRRAESPSKRQARTAEYQRERKRDALFIEQLSKAFDFTLRDREQLDGRQVYVLEAAPKSGYRPPVLEAEVLTGMQGKLWIDAATFQWVKVEAEVVHPVYIAGFVARVEPGTHFELEYGPVGDGVWLPTHFLMRSRSQLLLLLTRRTSADQTYFDYRKTEQATLASASESPRPAP